MCCLIADSAYEKGGGGGGLGERRGSVPVVCSADDDAMEPPSTPSRLAVSTRLSLSLSLSRLAVSTLCIETIRRKEVCLLRRSTRFLTLVENRSCKNRLAFGDLSDQKKSCVVEEEPFFKRVVPKGVTTRLV